MTQACPTREQLVRMLDDDLAVGEAVAVESHVARCERCQAILEELTQDPTPGPTPVGGPCSTAIGSASLWERLRRVPPSADPDTTLGGDDSGRTRSRGHEGPAPLPEIPGYLVEAEIGRGGMGVVYRAAQLHAGRTVALKMVQGADRSRPEDLLRFRLEGEALARLRHPNIVQVYEVGIHEGRPYFSMEYVAGGTLASRLPALVDDPKAAATMAETIARAVHDAHLSGLVHRDLKPANVLMDDRDAPKVTDFGLAKRIGGESDLTRTGEILGSPSYMAPEQATDGASVGVLADVYALGAILYELLCGRPPFRGESTWATLMQVVHEPPEPPSRWRVGVPRDLEVIALKCLAKTPGQRYPSADALAADLRRYLDGRTITARPAGWPERLGKWARRRPAAAAGLAALTLGLVGVYVGTLAFSAQLSRALKRANAAEDAAATRAGEASRQRDLAMKALRELVYGVNERLGKLPAARSLRQSLLDTAIAGLGEIARETEAGTPDQSRADAHLRLGALYKEAGRIPEATRQFDLAIEVVEGVLRQTPDDPKALWTLADALVRAGERATEDNRPDDALPLLRRGVEAAERAAALGATELADLNRCDAYTALTRNRLWARDAAGARAAVESMTRLARSAAAKAPGAERPLFLQAEAALMASDVERLEGKPDSALARTREAADLLRRASALDPDNARTADLLLVTESNLGEAAFDAGDYDEATKRFTSVIGRLDALTKADPESLSHQTRWIDTQANLAQVDARRGRYAEAAARLGPALERLKALKDAGRLDGLPVYGFERIEAMERDLAFHRAAPRGLADLEFARSQPISIAARLLWVRLLDAANAGPARAGDFSATADAIRDLTAADVGSLLMVAQLQAVASGRVPEARREAFRAASVANLSKAVDLGFDDRARLETEPPYESIRARPDFRAVLDRIKPK